MQSLDKCQVPDQSIHDALLATCYVLQMQSTFIDDGFRDYMIMGRGSGHMMQRMRGPDSKIDDWQLRSLETYVDRSFRMLDADTLVFRVEQSASLASSLLLLLPSCVTAEETAFCAGMMMFASFLQQPQYESVFCPDSVAITSLTKEQHMGRLVIYGRTLPVCLLNRGPN